ncbi:MAG: hypothetical protein K8I27_00900 [Planctomycetes bacterium]|nr:hypothetical protein [Planctomycetota bacterium]
MRKAGVILGVLILIGGFVAAWMVLSADARTLTVNNLAGPMDLQPLDSPGVTADAANPDEADSPIGVEHERDAGRPGPGRVSDTPGAESKPGVDTERTTSTPPGESAKPEAGKMPASTDAGETPVPPLKPEPFIKGHTPPAGQNLGNVRPRSRRIAQPSGVKRLEEVTPKLMQDRRGLYAQYFGLSDADLTKLDKSDPDMVRIDRQVYFPDREAFSDLPISLNNFAAEWTGFLVIDEPGDYWLFWGADNGGRVELDGETVLLQDGMVRYVEVSTVLTLEPGLHPLKIEFAQSHNNVADWAKCAAAFMYVPEGESKPVPVPPEMLMVPEWMWTDNAPIITSLSKTEGEIGDEITVYGQALFDEFDNGDGTQDAYPKVTFAGQPAQLLDRSAGELRVRVPVGAQTGDVVVYKVRRISSLPLSALKAGRKPGPYDIPSNSLRFSVTTQFGVRAKWHDFEGWENFGISVLDDREPDFLSNCESVYFSSMEDLHGPQIDVPFQKEVVGARFEFRLGVPVHPGKSVHAYGLISNSPIRATVNGEVIEPPYSAPGRLRSLKFSLPCTADNFANIVVEWVSYTVADRLLFLGAQLETDYSDDESYDGLHPRYFYLPAEAPEPPRIDAIGWRGEQPPGPDFVYDTGEDGEAISVGGGFTMIWSHKPDYDWEADNFELLIDGIVVETTGGDPPPAEYPWLVSKDYGVIPEGVREGVAIIRITCEDGTIVESEPYYFNLAIQGLATYLYDLPEGSGLDELPDLAPLHCFKVRKDRQINFESAADFDLPFPAETFVIEWLGGLIIEEEGDYEFICRSDDGMKLWLDDNVVIDANHRQSPAENKATVHLVPGTYRFRMQYFENNQHEVCVLEWRATRGEGEVLEELVPRQVIPARAFSLDVHPPFPAKTSTGKKTDGS